MSWEVILSLVWVTLFFSFWLFTLFYIKRGIFMTNKEKDRWFRMVVSGNLFALVIFWTKGRKKRIA